MLNQLRRQITEQKAQETLIGIVEETEAILPDRKLAAEQEFRQALNAINRLPPKCREVFYLRRIEGLSHSEIASKLGIANSTVETHLAKGIRLCHQYMREEQQELVSAEILNTGRYADEIG